MKPWRNLPPAGRGRQDGRLKQPSEEDPLRSRRSFLNLRLRRVPDNPEQPLMESFEATLEERRTKGLSADQSFDEVYNNKLSRQMLPRQGFKAHAERISGHTPILGPVGGQNSARSKSLIQRHFQEFESGCGGRI